MRIRRLASAWLLAFWLPAGLVPPPLVLACSPAFREGESVQVAGESALIVWDPGSKTEHFIRRASFRTRAQDFGFLVPTPTQPELGEFDEGLFEAVDRITWPRHVYETKVRTAFGIGPLPEFLDGRHPEPMSGEMAVTASAPSGDVKVLHEQTVAGFDAAILKADDPEALSRWLRDHGYEQRPALVDWLRWYTDHAWVITAFKMTKGAGEGPALEARAVRMSFHADRPFYPYREPEDMRASAGGGPRLLRVFFLADRKYEGTLGDSGTWPASTAWAGPAPAVAGQVTSALKVVEPGLAKRLESARYLTEFEDRSSPRPGTDEVYFRPAADTSAVERPPIVHTKVEVRYLPGFWGGLGAALLVAVGVPAGLIYRDRLRRPGKSQPEL